MRKLTLQGVINFQKSDSDKCVCCVGNHIFSGGIKLKDKNLNDTIHAYLFENKYEFDNKKVRIIIEVQNE